MSAIKISKNARETHKEYRLNQFVSREDAIIFLSRKDGIEFETATKMFDALDTQSSNRAASQRGRSLINKSSMEIELSTVAILAETLGDMDWIEIITNRASHAKTPKRKIQIILDGQEKLRELIERKNHPERY
jgi:hypothetical protein